MKRPHQTERRADQPRSFFFHFVANVLLASLALFAGALFGERVPRDRLGIAFIAVCLVAAALVPVTRGWERVGIARRQGEAQRNRRAFFDGKPSEKKPSGKKEKPTGDSEPTEDAEE